LENGFYFHYYLDFRGRLYADSPIAYTHNRLFRYFYYYGEYSSEEKKYYSNYLNEDFLKKLNVILEKTDLTTKYPNIDYQSSIAKYYIIIIFFEIGKIFKNRYVVENKGELTFDQIQEVGIKYYCRPELSDCGLYSIIEYTSLILMLDDLNIQKYYKYPIFKDATASGLQILAVLLGGVDLNTYTKTNLISQNVWHDTYYYIIEIFKKEVDVPQHLTTYFNRSNLKKTIMTYNYNATLITC
jgi:hypothetical protein